MMGMHSPRGVASCRGHRGALPPCHETANAPAAWRAHESSRNEMKATRLASPSSAYAAPLGGGSVVINRECRGTLVTMAQVFLRLDDCAHMRGRSSSSLPRCERECSKRFIPLPCPFAPRAAPFNRCRGRPPNEAIYHTSVGPLLVTISYRLMQYPIIGS